MDAKEYNMEKWPISYKSVFSKYAECANEDKVIDEQIENVGELFKNFRRTAKRFNIHTEAELDTESQENAVVIKEENMCDENDSIILMVQQAEHPQTPKVMDTLPMTAKINVRSANTIRTKSTYTKRKITPDSKIPVPKLASPRLRKNNLKFGKKITNMEHGHYEVLNINFE